MALITPRSDATLAERDALPRTAALSTLWRTINRLGFRIAKRHSPTEQRRADVAARGSGKTLWHCTTRAPTSSSMNPASRPISCVGTAGASRVAPPRLHALRPLADAHVVVAYVSTLPVTAVFDGRSTIRGFSPAPSKCSSRCAPATWSCSTTSRCIELEVQAAIEPVGARRRFLPPYSPDFNAIELALRS